MDDNEKIEILKLCDNYPKLKDVNGVQTEHAFIKQDNSIITKLRQSFLTSCENFWNFKIENDFDYIGWVYIDNSEIKAKRTFHTHNKINPFTLTGILYLNLPESSTPTEFLVGNKKFILPKVIYNWFIFNSNFPHIPGRVTNKKSRYCLSMDLWLK